MTSTQPIRFFSNPPAASTTTESPTLTAGFAPLASSLLAWETAHVNRASNPPTGGSLHELVNVFSEFLQLADTLDQQHGPDGRLPLDDVPEAVDEAMRCAAALTPFVERASAAISADVVEGLHTSTIGIGLWCMRHEVEILTTEPLVNALAIRSNAASTRQDTAAIFALMQGFVSHLTPTLSIDLERSNPQRPWRLLNLNFAITAIRTGDEAMVRYAFDTLNANLPDERRSFYEEAYAAASQPGFPTEPRQLIEAQLATITPRR